MRFSFKNSLVLGLLAAAVGHSAVQALPAIVIHLKSEGIQVQSEPLSIPAVEPASNATPESGVVVVAVNQVDPVAQSILDLSNAARNQAGLGSLRFSAKLNAAAKRHAKDLANGAEFSHTGSDGSSMKERVQDEGYVYWSIAENIYYQSPENKPERAVQGWLKSPGHRRNLLNARFTEMGVGYVKNGRNHYYVQVFGKPQ